MATTLQLRNVPDDLRRQLEERAARSETSLNDYVLRLLARAVRRKRADDTIRRLGRREPVDPDESSAQAIRRERNTR